MAAFLELLQEQQSSSLAPTKSDVYPVEASYRIKTGDQLVVMVGGRRVGFAHHGIALGLNEQGEMEVADFSRPGARIGVRGNRLMIRPLEQFLARHNFFGIVRYTHADPEAAAARLIRCAWLARTSVELDRRHQLWHYHWLAENCETFASTCATGDRTPSEQALRVIAAVQHDLRKGEESFLTGLVGLVYAVCAEAVMWASRHLRG